MNVLLPFHTEPFVVGYVKTEYTVTESEGPVEICINLTRPEIDIEDEIVHVESYANDSSIYIPAGAALASKLLMISNGLHIIYDHFFSAPDPPNPLYGTYDKVESSDYEQQVFGFNQIRNEEINATRRIICYNQTIYDDVRLEMSEYVGMTLTVDDLETRTTVNTLERPMYDQVAIQILDDDGKFWSIFCHLHLSSVLL